MYRLRTFAHVSLLTVSALLASSPGASAWWRDGPVYKQRIRVRGGGFYPWPTVAGGALVPGAGELFSESYAWPFYSTTAELAPMTYTVRRGISSSSDSELLRETVRSEFARQRAESLEGAKGTVGGGGTTTTTMQPGGATSSALEGRVSALEAKVDALATRVDRVESAFNDYVDKQKQKALADALDTLARGQDRLQTTLKNQGKATAEIFGELLKDKPMTDTIQKNLKILKGE